MANLTRVFLSAILCLFLTGTAYSSHAETLRVASFNIQFLGHFKNRDDAALASLMSPFDLVFVQELVAPPIAGAYPDGTPFEADKEAKSFFDAMAANGFTYVLSEEDTGTGAKNHKTTSATEWFVAFYRPEKVAFDAALAKGFLGDDRSDHPDYERVPYAFPFRAPPEGSADDLVFISVHLQPGASKKKRDRRAHEFQAIFNWIKSRPGTERDYVILGDMNIEDCEELASILIEGFASLNDTCIPTNTNINGPKPYDHVIYNVKDSGDEIHRNRSFQLIDLVEAMRKHWPTELGPYPGDPYNHNTFRTRYSDHHPIAFEVTIDGIDDD